MVPVAVLPTMIGVSEYQDEMAICMPSMLYWDFIGRIFPFFWIFFLDQAILQDSRNEKKAG